MSNDLINEFISNLISTVEPDKPLWNKEVDLRKVKPHWGYVDGCMLMGIYRIFQATNKDELITFIERYVSFFVNNEGKILSYNKSTYNCDLINEGKLLFPIWHHTQSDKYWQAILTLIEQLNEQPRTVEGNFWHKLRYPNQVWLDGLYMVQPFYAEYAIETKNSSIISDIVSQFLTVEEKMKDKDTGLYFHGYDSSYKMFWASKKNGCSENFWTRSIGWLCMALVDTIEIIQLSYQTESEKLSVMLRDLVEALVSLMDKETRLFFQITNLGGRVGNYTETSGSAAISYTLLKGSRLGVLPSFYSKIGKEIFDNLLKYKTYEKNEELHLKDICLVAGLGGEKEQSRRDGSYEYYISEPVVEDDAKGFSTLLMAYSELLLN